MIKTRGAHDTLVSLLAEFANVPRSDIRVKPPALAIYHFLELFSHISMSVFKIATLALRNKSKFDAKFASFSMYDGALRGRYDPRREAYFDYRAAYDTASYIAQIFAKRLGSMMAISALFSIVFCVAGLMLSFELNLTGGDR